MQGHYYWLSTLPVLDSLATEPPVTLEQFLEEIGSDHSLWTMARVLFLSNDLVLRESVLAGELAWDEASPVVLTEKQLSNDQPLPESLSIEPDERRGLLPVEALWEAYYQDASRLGQQEGSAFLLDWVGYEIALRNALLEERAKVLELETTPAMIAVEWMTDGLDLSGVVNDWSAAETPLDGQRVLDNARWQWLVEHDRWYSFDNDELLAYAAKLLLLWRRRRMEQQEVDMDSLTETLCTAASSASAVESE